MQHPTTVPALKLREANSPRGKMVPSYSGLISRKQRISAGQTPLSLVGLTECPRQCLAGFEPATPAFATVSDR
jgi:hypothetical protein